MNKVSVEEKNTQKSKTKIQFGLTLKRIRETEKISQAELAKKLGVSTSAVGMWESGKNSPTVEILLELSKIFNVTVDCLLGTKENEKVFKVPVFPQSIALSQLTDEYCCEYRSYNAHSACGKYIGIKLYNGDIAMVKLNGKFKDGDIVVVTNLDDSIVFRKINILDKGYIFSDIFDTTAPIYVSISELAKGSFKITGVVEEIHKILC